MTGSDPDERSQRLETRLIHASSRAGDFAGAKVLPIVRSTVFEADDSAGYHEIKYPRLSTLPGHAEVGAVMASIEAGEAGLVTSSGMSAITTTLLATLEGGGHLLAQEPLYGASFAFVGRDLPKLGSDSTFIDVEQPAAWQAELKPATRAIYVESITNPLLNVADHEKIVAFARQHGLVSIIDNTFASPINFQPLRMGYDLVVHSATKYLNGHSDVCAGVVVGRTQRVEGIKRWLDRLGGAADPEAG
jgi:cystathionine beta-lyase/cystathionine gamma-synthase